MSEKHRYSFLDSSRGLAAFVVLLAHTIKTFSPEYFSSSFCFLWDSEAAVLYFFILSGFVLTESIKERSLSPYSYFNFIGRRVLRIYPAFIFVLLLAFILFPFISGQTSGWLTDYWKNIPEVSDLFKQAILIVRIPNDPAYRLLPHDWTLSVEILISMTLPFLAKASEKFSWLLLAMIYILVKVLPIDPFIFDFTLGAILSAQKEKLISAWKKLHFLGHTFLIILALFLINLDSFVPFQLKEINAFAIHFKSWGLILLLIALISSPKLQNILTNKLLIFHGKISYSFYLIHFILIAILFKVQPEISLVLALSAVFLTTLIFSAISYFLVEKPCIQAAKKYFSGQKGQ